MQIIEINVDMDGVIADFDQLADTLTKKYFQKTLEQASKREMWTAIGKFQKTSSTGFWQMLMPMEGSDLMMDFIHNTGIDYGILSAVGNKGFNANPQKLRWMADTFPQTPTIRLVTSSSDKAKFAKPGAVLIDDRDKSIDPWVEAGGIGILHKDCATTIEKLKQLLLLHNP